MAIVILKHELLFLSILKPIKAALKKAAFIGFFIDLELSKSFWIFRQRAHACCVCRLRNAMTLAEFFHAAG